MDKRNATRSVIFNVRVTPEERDVINRKMVEMGIKNRSTFLRKRAFECPIIEVDMSDFAKLIPLVRTESDRLNECTKLANETGEIRLKDIKELQDSHNEIIKSFQAILDRFD